MTLTLNACLQKAALRLKEAGLSDPLREARHLMIAYFHLTPIQIMMEGAMPLPTKESTLFFMGIERRAQREPLARILGYSEFWEDRFKINEATLEPRQDSETMIRAVLDSFPVVESELSLVDVGTGCGCLLLSILKARPLARGVGIDCSESALACARENAITLHLSDRSHFRLGCWLQETHEVFDVILSNPPYIPKQDIKNLMSEVRDFDPLLALDGGDDGLAAFRVLIPDARRCLKKDGWLFLEHGRDQEELLAPLLRREGFTELISRRDYSGINRCLIAR